MLLRSREIQQRCAEAVLLEQAHIHLHPVFQEHAHFVFAVREDFLDARVLQNMLSHGVDILLLVLAGKHGYQRNRDRRWSRGRGGRSRPA